MQYTFSPNLASRSPFRIAPSPLYKTYFVFVSLSLDTKYLRLTFNLSCLDLEWVIWPKSTKLPFSGKWYNGHANVPLRSPAVGSITDWQYQLLLIWTHHQIHVEAMLPVAASSQGLSTARLWTQAHSGKMQDSSNRWLLQQHSQLVCLIFSQKCAAVQDFSFSRRLSFPPLLLPNVSRLSLGLKTLPAFFCCLS